MFLTRRFGVKKRVPFAVTYTEESEISVPGLEYGLLRRKRFWFGLVVSLTFLAIFLYRTNLGEIRDAFRGVDYALALVAVPLYFVGFWLRTVRWRLLLRPVADVPTLRLYPVVLIGLMANNVAPARVGELVRAYLVGERERISKSTALGTIAVDRAFDGLTLVAILGIVTAFFGADAEVKAIGVATALSFAAAATVLVALAYSPDRARRFILGLVRLLPRRLEAKVEGLLDSFLSGLVVIRSPLVLLAAAVASLGSWLVEGSLYWLVGQAFGLDVGFHVSLLILAAANLALSILASPGGVGPFETATQAVLLFFSVAAGPAAAYAIVLHVLLLAPVIVAGFLLLWITQFTLDDIFGVSRRPAVNVVPRPAGRAE